MAGAALILLGPAGCSGPGGSGDGTVLARVADRAITTADVDARIAELPQMARPEYATDAGRARLLRQLVEEEVLYRAALDAGLERDDAVQRRLTSSRRQILVQAMLDREQGRLARVDEKEARAFYDAHRDEYRTEETRRVRLLVARTRVIAERVREMALEGQPFEMLCQKFSVEPYVIEAKGLLPEPVRRGKAVPWLGNHVAFHEAVFAVENGGITGVFETPKGFHVARIEEVREARQRPFEEVRADVEARIVRERSTKGLPELVEGLKEKYHAEIVEPAGRSAEELFTRAQQSPDPAERIALWEELVERYPADPHVVEAIFMIGFTRSEELGDAEGARAAFQRVVDEFPGSELAQSAGWMLTSGQDGEAAPGLDEAPEEPAPSGE